MPKKNRITMVALLLLAGASLAVAQKVEVSTTENQLRAKVEFAPCMLESLNNGKFSIAKVDGLLNLMSPGNPALPFYNMRLLVPTNAEVANVTITCDEKDLAGNVKIAPAAMPLAAFMADHQGDMTDLQGTYKNGGWFPENSYSEWSQNDYAGYRLVNVNLYPVRYEGLLGKVRQSQTFYVNLDLKPARTQSEVQPDFETKVQGMVCNPDAAPSYRQYAYAGCREEVPYMIITPKKFVKNWEPLTKYLESDEKIKTKVVATEEVYADYDGRNTAEKVRSCISKAFKENKTRYVLLGGAARRGSELVPIPRFNIDFTYKYANGQTQRLHDNMPADHYYASLSSDFNAKKFVPSEVAIGRAPVSDATQITNFINKTIQAYKNAKSSPKALFVGEHLFNSGQFGLKKTIYGAAYMEELRQGSSAHGFKTAGFSSNWSTDKLYEKDGKYTAAQVKQKLQSGVHWVNQVGHSAPNLNMKLSPSSASSLTNSVPFLYYTSGCNSGRFTGDSVVPLFAEEDAARAGECVSEALILGKCGAFGVVSNWSYGLAPEDPEAYTNVEAPGACAYFNRYFCDAYFTGGLNRAGDMMNYMKDKTISWMSDSKLQTETMRWTYMQLHLLGDPRAPLPKQ